MPATEGLRPGSDPVQRMRNQVKAAERKAKKVAEGDAAAKKGKGGRKHAVAVSEGESEPKSEQICCECSP